MRGTHGGRHRDSDDVASDGRAYAHVAAAATHRGLADDACVPAQNRTLRTAARAQRRAWCVWPALVVYNCQLGAVGSPALAHSPVLPPPPLLSLLPLPPPLSASPTVAALFHASPVTPRQPYRRRPRTAARTPSGIPGQYAVMLGVETRELTLLLSGQVHTHRVCVRRLQRSGRVDTQYAMLVKFYLQCTAPRMMELMAWPGAASRPG